MFISVASNPRNLTYSLPSSISRIVGETSKQTNWVQDTLVTNYWGLWEPRERSQIHFLSSVLFNQRALQATPGCPGYPMLCVTNHPQLCTLKSWYILISHGSLIWLGWLVLAWVFHAVCMSEFGWDWTYLKTLPGRCSSWHTQHDGHQQGEQSMGPPNMGCPCGRFLQHGGWLLREIIPTSTQETPVDATWLLTT